MSAPIFLGVVIGLVFGYNAGRLHQQRIGAKGAYLGMKRGLPGARKASWLALGRFLRAAIVIGFVLLILGRCVAIEAAG